MCYMVAIVEGKEQTFKDDEIDRVLHDMSYGKPVTVVEIYSEKEGKQCSQ